MILRRAGSLPDLIVNEHERGAECSEAGCVSQPLSRQQGENPGSPVACAGMTLGGGCVEKRTEAACGGVGRDVEDKQKDPPVSIEKNQAGLKTVSSRTGA